MPDISTIDLNCTYCNKVVTKNYIDYMNKKKKGRENFYCDKSCSAKDRKRKNDIKRGCESYNNDIKQDDKKLKKPKAESYCFNCGKIFTRLRSAYKYAIKNGQRKFFCSKECKSLNSTQEAIVRKKLIDYEKIPKIVKGPSQDSLPYKVYRVSSPKELVLRKPPIEKKRGAISGVEPDSDFYIDSSPPFAAFLYKDQAIMFGEMLYPDNYVIVDESPVPEYRNDDQNSSDYYRDLIKAIEEA